MNMLMLEERRGMITPEFLNQTDNVNYENFFEISKERPVSGHVRKRSENKFTKKKKKLKSYSNKSCG